MARLLDIPVVPCNRKSLDFRLNLSRSHHISLMVTTTTLRQPVRVTIEGFPHELLGAVLRTHL